MAREGEEYERFVYERFSRLLVDSVVTLSDRIMGRESGLERQIDVSIRTSVDDRDLLYIVSCKDRAKRPADIQVLGEFSAVIRDVGASKGFLICTSGFANSNHQYARTLGIELFTVEDIKSERWSTDVEIPFIYIKKHTNYQLAAEFVANAELVERNRDQPLDIHFDAASRITLDGGQTSMSIREHIESMLNAMTIEPQEVVALDLLRPNLQVQIADVWVPCSELTVDLTVGRTIYLKYVKPDEYSHIRDHLRETVLPLHVTISGVFPILDATFVEVPGDRAPVLPGLFVQVEEWTDLERAQGSASGTNHAG